MILNIIPQVLFIIEQLSEFILAIILHVLKEAKKLIPWKSQMWFRVVMGCAGKRQTYCHLMTQFRNKVNDNEGH